MKLTMKDKITDKQWLTRKCECLDCNHTFRHSDIVLNKLLNGATAEDGTFFIRWDSRKVALGEHKYEPVCPQCGSDRVYDFKEVERPIKMPTDAIKCANTPRCIYKFGQIQLYYSYCFSNTMQFNLSIDEYENSSLWVDLNDFVSKDSAGVYHIFDAKTKIEKYVNLCSGCGNSRHASIYPFFCKKYRCTTIGPHGRCWIQS